MDQSEKVEESLNRMELLYSISLVKIANQNCKLFVASVPDQLVDEAIDEISKSMDLRIKQNSISVSAVEAAISTFLDRLKEKVAEMSPPPNPLERLVESTDRYLHFSSDVLTMVLFATLVALAGLFLDNVAIVIGAMLLSPLLGPINAFAVNASLGRIRRLAKNQLSILILLGSIIALSALGTFIASRFVELGITSQITLRSHASLIDIGIAFILGCAGGLALFVAIPEILVGVAVAVALVPPVAVSGIGIAMLNIDIFFGAIMLSLVNLFGLELGSAITLKIKGISPRLYYQKAEARRHSTYSILILTLLLIILSLVVMLINP